ncbi:hypothetical protein lerEdw1_001100 [Lerista edwardsae]|nr:hypothetical protein lerEdw1_001100 [Lerista edwardsae]
MDAEETPLKHEVSFLDDDDAIAALASFHMPEEVALPEAMEGLPAGSSSTLHSQSLLRAHTSSRVVTATSEATMADEESERDSVRTGESREMPEDQQPQDLAHLDLFELRSVVRENRNINAMIKLETDMFEKFYNRMEPRDLMTEKQGSSLDLGQVQYPRSRRRSKSRITTDRLIFLTVEQKCDLAQRELDETKEDMQRMKENSDRLLQNYLAVLEEADIRIADIKKATVDFDKDIVRTIIKRKGSVIASEKVLKYMEDKIHSRDVLKEKIRLKNDSLKVQKKKMQMQLKQKEELGEALHEVDFQQLKIENAQFLEKIDERNQELLQLKLTVGSALQILNFYKKKLQNANAMASHLVKEIAQRFESMEKIKWEGLNVEEVGTKAVAGGGEPGLHGQDSLLSPHNGKLRGQNPGAKAKEEKLPVKVMILFLLQEQSIAKHLNRKLRKQLSMFRVPPVLSYVHKKMSVCELEYTIKIWERKVEIAEMALQSYRNVWHKAKMASHELQTLLPEQVTR